MSLCVADVGAVELKGEQRRLFAAGAAADLHDHVARIAGVFWQQFPPDPRSEFGGRRFASANSLSAIARISGVVFRQQRRGLGGGLFGRLVAIEQTDECADLRALLGELVHSLKIGGDIRRPHLVR